MFSAYGPWLAYKLIGTNTRNYGSERARKLLPVVAFQPHHVGPNNTFWVPVGEVIYLIQGNEVIEQ